MAWGLFNERNQRGKSKIYLLINNIFDLEFYGEQETIGGASLVVQWLRIQLPMQGEHGFELWSGKIPQATEQRRPCATATEPVGLEPVLRDKRSHRSEKPAHRNEE